MTWLDISNRYMQVIIKELNKHLSDGLERYLMIWHAIDGDKSNIFIAGLWLGNNSTRLPFTVLHGQHIEASRCEGSRISTHVGNVVVLRQWRWRRGRGRVGFTVGYSGSWGRDTEKSRGCPGLLLYRGDPGRK